MWYINPKWLSHLIPYLISPISLIYKLKYKYGIMWYINPKWLSHLIPYLISPISLIYKWKYKYMVLCGIYILSDYLISSHISYLPYLSFIN